MPKTRSKTARKSDLQQQVKDLTDELNALKRSTSTPPATSSENIQEMCPEPNEERRDNDPQNIMTDADGAQNDVIEEMITAGIETDDSISMHEITFQWDPNVPLTSHVSETIRRKIIDDKYVDIATLMNNSEAGAKESILTVVNGKICIKQKKTPKNIQHRYLVRRFRDIYSYLYNKIPPCHGITHAIHG